MRSYVHGYKVGSLVPIRFSGHVIVDGATVDLEPLEGDVLHLAFLVVTIDDGHVGLLAVVAYMAKGDVLNSTTRRGTVFGVVAHLDMEQAPLMDILDADIVEKHIFHVVIVAAVDGHAALVVNLWFALTDNIDILIHEPYDAVGLGRIAMQTDKDGVCHIGPQRRVAHPYVVHRTGETLAGGIGRSAIIRAAAEDTVVQHVRRSKYIEPIAP